MQPDLTTRARKLAAVLLGFPPADRERELAARCESDEALALAVRSRLRALELAGTDEISSTATIASTRVSSGNEVGPVPATLGRFRLIREVGRGGMGIVYEAEQDLPRRRVALKTLPRGHSPQAIEQFRIEVDATARVVHPGIPQVYEVFEVDGVPVLVMELVPGLELREAVRGMERERRVAVLRDIALAVHAAHERGVVHRDLKPSNVLLTGDGQPKVLDFGIAALGHGGVSQACTLAYAAPEQLAGGHTDLRCDVYGLGAIGFEILTGRLASNSNAIDPPPELPSALAAILVRAMAPAPADRYVSAKALAEDLDRYLRWRPVQAFDDRFELVRDERTIIRRKRSTGELVGSLRVLDLSLDGDSRWCGVALPAQLAARSVVLDEVALGEDARGTGTLAALFEAAFELGLNSGSLLSFALCTPARYPDQLRLGFRTIGRVIRDPALGHAVPMVLVHHDLEHLVRMDSPLVPVLRTHGRFGDDRGLRWFAETSASGAGPQSGMPEGEWLDTTLFADLSEQGRRELFQSSTRRPGNPGDTLIHAGEVGRWMAIVDSGLVEVVIGDEVLAVRGPGELIGEMGFVLDRPRTAKIVVAAPGTSIMILSPEALGQLSSASDREVLWRNLAIVLANKLDVQTRQSARRPVT